jgi:hypothetical protein
VTDIRARLADALRGTDRYLSGSDPDQLADVLLSLPGIAIVELPEPNTIAVAAGDLVEFRIVGGDSVLYQPDGARRVAAALLAAADAAEAK